MRTCDTSLVQNTEPLASGPNGKVSAIENRPSAEPVVHVAKSKEFRFADYGMNWEISDKNSFHSPFSWNGP